MFKISLKFLILVVLLAAAPFSKAQAVVPDFPLTVGGGWSSFIAEGTGSDWDRSYSFNLSGPGILTVTDLFVSGDRYEVLDLNLGTLGLTSVPTSFGDQIFADFDAAAADPRWSTGIFNLNPGNYQITGKVHSSLFQETSGSVKVDLLATGIPEPSTFLMLGLALAGWGFRRFSAR